MKAFFTGEAEKVFAGEDKFRQDVSPEIPVNEKIKPPSPMMGRSTESAKTSRNDKRSRGTVNLLRSTTPSPHHVGRAAQVDDQTTTKSTTMITDQRECEPSIL